MAEDGSVTSWLPGPDDETPPLALTDLGEILHAQLELHRARLLHKTA